MNGILVPLCPALPAMCYRAMPARDVSTAQTVVSQLDQNQTVTVSGRSHYHWPVNSQIGKSTAVKNRLIPRLRRRGLTVSYLDLQKLMYRRDLYGFSHCYFEPLMSKIQRMREADVYVFDEIHHALPFRNGAQHYGVQGGLYARTTMAFWRMVENHLLRGGQIVYVTAVHPLSSDYEGALFNDVIASFFTSPVVELGSIL